MIRFGVLEDLEEVNKIRKEVNDLHVEGEPTIFKGFTKDIADYINEFINTDNKKLLVCEDNGIICGYAMLEFCIKPESIYRYELKFIDVQELGVLKGCQSKGYGKMLINKIIELAKEKGYPKIELNMWAFNENALKFYKKIGFKTYRRYMKMDVKPIE